MSTIAIAIAGIGLLVVVAIVVGIVDAIQAPAWRRIAAERHENWQRRQLQHLGSHRRRSGDG
jgi:hypothetical protein